MQIGKILLNNPVIMAPMAGVTDYPYRQILRKMGCELVYTEMVSSKGLVYGNKKTADLIDFNAERGLISVQLFGEESEVLAEAAGLVARDYKPDLIDINMGCPTPKIVKNGSGSALMKNPGLAGEIVAKVVKAVDCPVTIKIRKGWDKEHINAAEIARIGEENGAQAVAVHGRTREDFYSGKADWGIIKEVKKAVNNIPVIGNGDIFEPEDAERMLESTGCDAVMIARGARGNPWLIKRTIHYLKSGELLPEPGYEEIIEMALYHLQETIKYFSCSTGIPRMRKHLNWYIKGLPYSTVVKERVNHLDDFDEIKFTLEEYLEQLKTRVK